MKPYQLDFLERVKQAIKSGENSMLVYRKQGYESKAFRLQLKQLAQQYDGILLEDRHAFTFVVQEYCRIGLYSYKESHEVADKFNRIDETICNHYGVPTGGISELWRKDDPAFRYTFLMVCYFMKLTPAHVIEQLGEDCFYESTEVLQQYNCILDGFRQDYNSGKHPNQVIDDIVNSIKSSTHPFAVYSWSNGGCQSDRSLFRHGLKSRLKISSIS